MLLPHGASMGAGYGPVVVAREPLDPERAAPDVEIAVPGRMTTAFLVLRLRARRLPLPRGAVRPDPRRGSRTAAPTPGCVIHEGQLTYAGRGLVKVLDLGEWWLLETGLPLPLGVNVARRDLGDDALPRAVARCCSSSIRAGLDEPRRGDAATRCGSARGLDRRARRPLRRHVRERADVRLRRGGPRQAVGGAAAAAAECGCGACRGARAQLEFQSTGSERYV